MHRMRVHLSNTSDENLSTRCHRFAQTRTCLDSDGPTTMRPPPVRCSKRSSGPPSPCVHPSRPSCGPHVAVAAPAPSSQLPIAVSAASPRRPAASSRLPLAISSPVLNILHAVIPADCPLCRPTGSVADVAASGRLPHAQGTKCRGPPSNPVSSASSKSHPDPQTSSRVWPSGPN
jgi:hypothetical protein